MKTVALLFSFAFVLVFTAPTDETHLLITVIYEVNKILKGGLEFQALLDSLVPAGFDQDRCRANGPKDFCIAETILSAISHTRHRIPLNNISKISRVLKQYNKVRNHSDKSKLGCGVYSSLGCKFLSCQRSGMMAQTDWYPG
uniref:Uncharacterized LOC109879483 n=1 Tax=Oncorhynchus kisutch TaxID=8019 RepID=A0A8C7J168_ONCKI